ncbi:signal peptidase I [Pigmentiphaga sp. GD03639]|uniref:signal peptidase I n=1 Tax=Pigmentiphaga sp. GD03639 TaxID=2975354 RepID=UPI00244BB6FD|nr:signal peptidase I [Pigmentiphaga sp. GD03639]MDH2235878.1 signal peptidase I [Pigmentiphaga sp. GD03639]
MSLNFALILFVLLVVTGIVWAFDRVSLRPQRTARMARAAAEFDAGRAQSVRAASGEAEVARQRQEAVDRAGKMPWWVEYSVSFFPVILFVFVLRSFVVEPFRIPSGSMMPTLQIGDLILVNKFSYGLRLPIVDKKVVPLGDPQRGDVVVFRYPVDPQVDYIKRVVGVPGDEVAYLNKRLTINGQEIPMKKVGEYFDPDRVSYAALYDENLKGVNHQILIDERRSPEIDPFGSYPNRDACEYSREGVRCKVPAGNYFVMGDNRDNSADSRYWGFVPDSNIVGKAFFVWMNFGDLKRIGRFH